MLARYAAALAKIAWTPRASTAVLTSRGCGRSLASGSDDNSKEPGDPAQKDMRARSRDDDDDDDLFSEQNIRDMSPVEVARLRVVYEYVKEHADVVEKGLEPVDIESNPLIDSRSFDVKTLPEVPDEALRQFRKDLPADQAKEARAVSTRGIWDSGRDDNSAVKAKEAESVTALVGDADNDSKWAAVDERTMDPFYLMRMRRQSTSGRPFGAGGSTGNMARSSRATALSSKRKCRLSDPRGRSTVDYREIGILSTFMNEHGKIVHRKRSALSAKAQRKVGRAVKTARQMALLHPEPRPGLTSDEMESMARETEARS